MFNRKLEKKIKELEDSVLTKKEVEPCDVCGCFLLWRNIKFVENWYNGHSHRKYYCSVHKPPYDSTVLTADGRLGYFKKFNQMVNEKGKPIKKEKK